MYPALFGVAIIVAMGMLYVSNNKIVVSVAAAVTLASITWTFYKTRTLTQIDKRTKKWSWLMLVLFVIIVLGAYQKLIS